MVNAGYAQSLYWANETTYGSAATVNQNLGIVQSINPTETNNLIKVRTLGGTRDYNNVIAGKFEISGTFDYYLQGGAFIRQAIGEDTASTATVDSGPKIHTGASYLHVMGSAASPTVDNFPSFTLELSDEEDTGALATTTNLNRTYTGCRVNSLSMSATIDEPVSMSVDWLAQGVTVSTAGATVVAADTKDPYVFYQGAVYATSGTVNAYTAMDTTSMIAEVNSFDLSVNNNAEATWYISGTTNIYQTLRGAKHIIPKGRDYDSSLNLHFSNKTMYQRFLGSESATQAQSSLTKYQVVFDFVRTGTIGSSPKLVTDDYIRIVCANCAFDTMNMPGAVEDIVNENIGVDLQSAKIYLVDADASYE